MKLKPLPVTEKMHISKVKDMSIILVAGANKYTAWFENKLNKFPYYPPFTHALQYVTNGDCVDVGFSTTIRKIEDVISSKTKTYICIQLKDLTKEQITQGISIAYRKAGEKSRKFRIYDVWGYIAFGLRKLGMKKVKGSEKYDFCSDQVVDINQEMEHPLFDGIDSEKISPCDLFNLLYEYDNRIIRKLTF